MPVMRKASGLTASPTPTMPYWLVRRRIAFLDRDDVAAGLAIGLDHLREAAGTGTHDHVGEEHGEGLVADQLARAPHGVAEAERLLLAGEADLARLRAGRARAPRAPRSCRARAASPRARTGCRNDPRSPPCSRPVTKMKCSIPASRASSTAYWMSGRSTTVSISLGIALVAGRKRVPSPATGKTALRMGAVIGQSLFVIGAGTNAGGRARRCIDYCFRSVKIPTRWLATNVSSGRHERPGHRRRRLYRQPHGLASHRCRRGRGRPRQSVDRLRMGGAARGQAGQRRLRRPGAGRRADRRARVDAIIHFAGSVVVPDSVADPLALLPQQHRQVAGADRSRGRGRACRISSSPRPPRSMARPSAYPVSEDAPLEPDVALRPLEADDRDDARRRGRRARPPYVALRYFNVAGADPEGPHRAIDARRDPSDQGRLRDRARQARRASPSSARTIRRRTAPASATTSTSPTSSPPTPTRCAISGPAAATWSPIAATAAASRCSRCIEAVKRVSGRDFPVALGPRRPGDPCGHRRLAGADHASASAGGRATTIST